MFEKLSTEVKASLYQRIISPFFGTYFIGLLIFNYRFILLLFTDLPFEEKFKLIDSGNSFFHFNFSPYLHHVTPDFYTTIILPTLFALVYIAVLPFFERWIALPVWKHHQNKLKEKRIQIDKLEIFTLDEKEKLIDEIFRLKKDTKTLKNELLVVDNNVNEQLVSQKLSLEEEHKENLEKLKIDLENQYKVKLDIQKKETEEKFFKQREANEKSIKDTIQENSKLISEKDFILGQIEGLKKTLSNKEKETQQLKDKNLNFFELIRNYESKIEEIEKKLNTIKNHNNKLERINQELEFKVNTLQSQLSSYTTDIDERIKKFEKEFGLETLKIFEVIYTKNILDNNFLNNIINNIQSHINFPRIKIDNILKKLILDGYISNSNDLIRYTDKFKHLLIRIFG